MSHEQLMYALLEIAIVILAVAYVYRIIRSDKKQEFLRKEVKRLKDKMLYMEPSFSDNVISHDKDGFQSRDLRKNKLGRGYIIPCNIKDLNDDEIYVSGDIIGYEDLSKLIKLEWIDVYARIWGIVDYDNLQFYDSEQGTILNTYDLWIHGPYSRMRFDDNFRVSARNLPVVAKSHTFTAGEFAEEYRKELDFLYDVHAKETKMAIMLSRFGMNYKIKDHIFNPGSKIDIPHPYPSDL